MRVALVHDYLNQYGGAEKVLEAFMQIYPNAPIYTLISDLSKLPRRFKEANVQNSFIQSIPFSKKHYKKMLGLFPIAIEQFDLRKFDLILSSSSAFAKGIITNPYQMHICYCHTPMRYIWDLYHQYMREDVGNPVYRFFLPTLLNRIRVWDYVSSQRVDHFIANSDNVANRIKKYYGRSSKTIHPPVQFDNFKVSSNIENYFLVVSRLLPYKRVDLVIETFNHLQWPLVVIGDGYDRNRLESIAGPTITFLGYQPDEVISEYYSKCKAFIIAGEEDFGITPLEAQASGRPVIAFRKGGALETVIEYETGLFFEEQNISELRNVLLSFSPEYFDSKKIREHAFQFSQSRFIEEIQKYIAESYSAYT